MNSITLGTYLEAAANDQRLRATHISLIAALLALSSGQDADGFFRISRRILMHLCHIRSKPTYHHYLRELVEYDYILYRPSYDYYNGSRIKLLEPGGQAGE